MERTTELPSAAVARPATRRGFIVAFTVVQTVVGFGLNAIGWGGVRSLLANPAREAFIVLSLVITGVALLSPVNFSSGVREDVGDRRILLPALLGPLVLCWLMPFMDRHDVATIDGDAVRWSGVVILAVGGVLRIWPMFVLGRRFSGLVAIQPGHELVTSGPYRWVRHPSYLGQMVAMVGWALVFRSSVGVIATALGFFLLRDRMDDEEALLASEFGPAYEDYRGRTSRLVPGVY